MQKIRRSHIFVAMLYVIPNFAIGILNEIRILVALMFFVFLVTTFDPFFGKNIPITKSETFQCVDNSACFQDFPRD